MNEMKEKLRIIFAAKVKDLYDKYPYGQPQAIGGVYYRLYKRTDGSIFLCTQYGTVGETLSSLIEILEMWGQIETEFRNTHENIIARGESILEKENDWKND